MQGVYYSYHTMDAVPHMQLTHPPDDMDSGNGNAKLSAL